MTGLSRAQLTRLIRQHRDTGRVEDRRGRPPAKPFERRYTAADIRLLAQVDATGQMSGPARACVAIRRRASAWRACPTAISTTCVSPRPTSAGAPRPSLGHRVARSQRRPGFLRVDTVHQGDRDGSKGLYHINIVDQVTQWQHVGTVEAISERFLLPVLQALLSAYPFSVHGFHSDNGSEYINHQTAIEYKRSRHPVLGWKPPFPVEPEPRPGVSTQRLPLSQTPPHLRKTRRPSLCQLRPRRR